MIRFSILVAFVSTIILPLGSAHALSLLEKSINGPDGAFDIHIVYPITGYAQIDERIKQIALAQHDDLDPNRPDPNRKYDHDDIIDRPQLSIDYSVGRNDETVFSLLLQGYFGGRHGQRIVEGLTFDVVSKRELLLPEFFRGEKGFEGLSHLLSARLSEMYRQDSVPRGQDQVQLDTAPFQLSAYPFYWTSDHLAVFLPYVSPNSSGYSREIDISNSDMARYLRPNVLTPLPSFDCKGASSKAERVICSSVELSRLDRKLFFQIHKVLAVTKALIILAKNQPFNEKRFSRYETKIGTILNIESKWSAERETLCPDASEKCLIEAYAEKLNDPDILI